MKTIILILIIVFFLQSVDGDKSRRKRELYTALTIFSIIGFILKLLYDLD